MIAHAALAGLIASLLLNFAVMWPHADWPILPAALAGWALADLGSGLVHMLMDYVPCPEKLEFGQIYFQARRNTDEYLRLKARIMKNASPFYRVVFDFKTHHPHPDALGRRDFAGLIQSTILCGALPISMSVNLLSLAVPLPVWFVAAMMTLSLGYAFSQYFHSTLHRDEAPLIVEALRHAKLLMAPTAHQVHHHTLDRDFAVITGWSNPVLNRLFNILKSRGILSDEALEPPRSL